jgi:hypothetical protein
MLSGENEFPRNRFGRRKWSEEPRLALGEVDANLFA